MSGQSQTHPTDAKRPLPPRKRSPIVTQLVKQVHHSAKIVSLQRLIQKGSERRFRCSDAIFVLVGDTGIEPVTSSGRDEPRARHSPAKHENHPWTSPHILLIRGRCHAISQSAPVPWPRAGTCQCWLESYLRFALALIMTKVRFGTASRALHEARLRARLSQTDLARRGCDAECDQRLRIGRAAPLPASPGKTGGRHRA
jgi:hypothetical protein